MNPGLLTKPGRLLLTRWPWTSLAYLLAQTVAGWLTVIVSPTVVLLPAWALAWCRVERRLVMLAGQPRIAPAGRTTVTWRELVQVFGTAVTAMLATLCGSGAWAVLAVTLFAPLTVALTGPIRLPGLVLASPPQQALAVLVGLAVLALLLWVATVVANALARLAGVLLGPDPEHLQRQVTSLSQATVRTQDQIALERRALERQLHDGAQLHLSAAGFRLGLLELQLADVQGAAGAAARRALGELREQIDAAADAVREVAHGLSPRILSEQGLGPALEELTAGLPVETDVSWEGRTGSGAPSPSDEASEDLYLIASEAITNAMKHSGCSRIEVDVARQDDVVQLTVRDDGAGGAAPTGRGILSMAARARRLGGTFELVSPDGGPTTVTVRIPSGGPR